MSATDVLQKRFAAALMPNYGLPQVALTRGEGCRVWDADGREYLDLFAGIAVSSLGHAHPALTAAVTRQVNALAHTSNLFLHEPGIALAERILALLGTGAGPAGARVFFANSGAEANEAAIKLVRRRQGRQNRKEQRPVMVATENGFHGRTMGALALTGKASIREPFGPFGIDVRFVPYGDAAALRAAVGADCAAVFVEPCQGEAGVIPPPPGYLRAARDACDQAWRGAGHRRDPERDRAHRALVRAPGRRRAPGPSDAGQGAGRGTADRGVHRIRRVRQRAG